MKVFVIVPDLSVSSDVKVIKKVEDVVSEVKAMCSSRYKRLHPVSSYSGKKLAVEDDVLLAALEQTGRLWLHDHSDELLYSISTVEVQ